MPLDDLARVTSALFARGGMDHHLRPARLHADTRLNRGAVGYVVEQPAADQTDAGRADRFAPQKPLSELVGGLSTRLRRITAIASPKAIIH